MSYDPTIGRWMETDPETYIDGANVFQFTTENPMTLVDPTGTEYKSIAKANYIQTEMTLGPGKADRDRKLANVTVELLADTSGDKAKLKLSFRWVALTNYVDQGQAVNLQAKLVYGINTSDLEWHANTDKNGSDLAL
jgi:hypothetical protein